MAINTLSEPTADQQLLALYNRGMRLAGPPEPLELDTSYAVCLLKLHPSVTAANYPALKTATEEVAGIQTISLLADHHTRASLPANKALAASVILDLRINAAEV